MKTLRAVMAAAIVVVVATPARAQDASGWRPAIAVAPVGSTDRLYGPADAEITLVVWLDPECPYCKRFGRTGEQLVDGAGGRVNLVVRLMPLPFHGAAAVTASTAALCVADQAGAPGFYRFLDAYLDRTRTNGKGLAPAAGRGDPVLALAADAGATDDAALRTCQRSAGTLRRVLVESESAAAAGVGGTPSVAILDNRSRDGLAADGAIPGDSIMSATNWLVARHGRQAVFPSGKPSATGTD